MKPLLVWILAILEENYRASYWESVAQNEAWLKLMMELTDDED